MPDILADVKMTDEEFEAKLLADSGFDSPEKIAERRVVLAKIDESPRLWRELWPLTDAYGEPGYMPAQGYDWSGFRDSSYRAIHAMALRLGLA